MVAKAKPMRQSAGDRKAADRAAAFAALAKHAAKESDRELLAPGSEVRVALNVYGHVNGRTFSERVLGMLQVGHDQPAAQSTGPNQAHLVAHLLELLPKTRRRQLLDSLPAFYLENGDLPAVGADSLSAAEVLLDQLRDKKTITKKGNVRFESRSEMTP